ncbi:hypothetical protein ALC57_05377 [Trachymyrmex cornetzi]|uniref:Glycoprotein n=1 Tax=Trachymyrmex cornetzi TaxID=471704 RepID=A0A151JAX0_9HYME|nr:hypothetical protein ALC57_05377 [Trachymyrmex cornetzi]
MQLSDYNKTPAIQCKVEIDRMINYCGMHSHVLIVHNGKREYIQEIGKSACRRLHETGTITLANAVLDLIKENATNFRSVTLAGSTSPDGKCIGAQYTDGYGSWKNVVVQASIRITIRKTELPIKQTTGHIILPSRASCRATNRYCLDNDGSETYWEPVPIDHCHFDRYDILYEGLATKLSPKEHQNSPTIYTVTTQETTFALTKIADFDICGYKLSQTEHPKLFILQTTKERKFKTRARISVDNLDIFLYVNSKFVYVEKHIKTQLTQLYRDIMEQKCALEKQVLQNALTLASIAPDETAHRIMKEPGYTAVVSGEVLHLIKCVPVECKLRHTSQCYNELPVTHNNASMFLQPRFRIITRTGTVRDCNEILPVMYKIHGTWIRLAPKPMEGLSPATIQPLTRPTWHYTSSSSLATSGIYNPEDLERLRSHIMFPVERPSMLNTIARGAMGNEIPAGSISMINLLDEASINKIAESAGKRVWRGFVTFGSASAGVLAIFIIIRVIKLIIDTAIHGYALHSIYGWSMHLVGAVWSSVTNLLLHLGRNSNTGAERQPSASFTEPLSPSTSENQHPGPVHPSEKIVESGLKRDKAFYTYSELKKYLDDNKENSVNKTPRSE